MSGPASLFCFAVSAFTPSCLLAVPFPYMAPVAKDFGIEIRRPLQDSNSCITSRILFESLTVHTYYGQIVSKGSIVPLGGPLDAECYSGRVQQPKEGVEE